MTPETATCKKCGHEIERTSLGGWGCRVRMIRGCAHIPAKDSVRPATLPASGQVAP